eukprot:863564-Alexandrium_andersonii.AAC.1
MAAQVRLMMVLVVKMAQMVVMLAVKKLVVATASRLKVTRMVPYCVVVLLKATTRMANEATATENIMMAGMLETVMVRRQWR